MSPQQASLQVLAAGHLLAVRPVARAARRRRQPFHWRSIRELARRQCALVHAALVIVNPPPSRAGAHLQAVHTRPGSPGGCIDRMTTTGQALPLRGIGAVQPADPL
jgi:hypothetical protein